MYTHAQQSDSSPVDDFRNSHIVWKEANARFHERFQEIVSAGRAEDLDVLAHELASKFDHFMQCSKAFVAGK